MVDVMLILHLNGLHPYKGWLIKQAKTDGGIRPKYYYLSPVYTVHAQLQVNSCMWSHGYQMYTGIRTIKVITSLYIKPRISIYTLAIDDFKLVIFHSHLDLRVCVRWIQCEYCHPVCYSWCLHKDITYLLRYLYAII